MIASGFGYGGSGGGAPAAAPSGGLSGVSVGAINVPDADSRSYAPGTSGMLPMPGAFQVYNQLLGLNAQNYQNTINAYLSGQNNINNNLNNILGGYGNLYSGIKNTLGVGGEGWGVALPGANAIEEQSAKARGDIRQGLINSGLGNSTVAAAMQNQNMLTTQRAYGELAANLANTAAGYAAKIGLEQQQAAMQGLGMQSSLSEAMGRTLGGYTFSNTAGPLYGSYSYNPPQQGGGGGGGYRGGGGGGGSSYGGGYGAGSGYGAGFAGPSYHAPESLGYSPGFASYYNPYPEMGAQGAVVSGGGGGFDWGGLGSDMSLAAGDDYGSYY